MCAGDQLRLLPPHGVLGGRGLEPLVRVFLLLALAAEVGRGGVCGYIVVLAAWEGPCSFWWEVDGGLAISLSVCLSPCKNMDGCRINYGPYPSVITAR
jgi:hypothetical protein